MASDVSLPKVTIPALPIGNLAAVANMVRKCGGRADVAVEPEELMRAERVIIAGVGAFDAGMRALEQGGWLDPLGRLARDGTVPVLGICLGMQLMCRRSEEGVLPGLAWFEADVRRIVLPAHSTLKVPHMGWNTVQVRNPCSVLQTRADEQRFYFVHSYHAVCDDPGDVVAVARYGQPLTAAIARGNLTGVQFHPEKSHRFGQQLITQFLSG